MGDYIKPKRFRPNKSAVEIIKKMGKEAITSRIVGDLYDSVKLVVRSKLIYSIDMSATMCALQPKCIQKYFKNFSAVLRNRSMRDSNHALTEYETVSRFVDIIFYKETPIVFSMEPSDHGYRSGLYTISTKKNRKNIHKFVDTIRAYNDKLSNTGNSDEYLYFEHDYPTSAFGFPRRNFDNVFISEYNKNLIIDQITNFKNKRDWYKQHHIPYHFGIVLYGEPGTGKSSIAQAIANHFKMNRFVMTGDRMSQCIDGAKDYVRHDGSLTAIIIDDVDLSVPDKRLSGGLYKEDAEYVAARRRHDLGSLLNVMDGIGCIEDVVYIFTTNDIEYLDPALKRAGRLDLKIHMSYINNEVFDQFVYYHYNTHIPKDYELVDGLTIADLQADIVSEMSYVDFLNKYRRN